MTPTIRVVLQAPEPVPGAGTRRVERSLVEAALLRASGATSIGRLCPRCGSGEHGQPWMRGGEATTYVSLAYTDGLTVAAWSSAGAVGVDVEREGARDAGVYGDLATWTRAEAILKATGEGLHRDPGDLPDVWSSPLTGLPPGYVGAVALLGGTELDGVSVSVEPAGHDDWRWVAYVPLARPDPTRPDQRSGRAAGHVRPQAVAAAGSDVVAATRRGTIKLPAHP